MRLLLSSIDCTRIPDPSATESEGLLLQELMQKGIMMFN